MNRLHGAYEIIKIESHFGGVDQVEVCQSGERLAEEDEWKQYEA